MTEQRNLRATRTGKVVSDKMDKTVVVAIERFVQHPLYQKGVKHTVKFKAHDENNDAHIGDTVQIVQTRPLSKDKCWRVVQIVERAK
ncbi:MAG: 30S ribosomal protein S17 [Acidaminococcaceae bacterium]